MKIGANIVGNLGGLAAGKKFDLAKALDDPQVSAFMQKVSSAIDPLDLESRKVVVDEMISALAAGREPADRIELLARLHGLLAEKKGADVERVALRLDDVLTECGLMPLVLEIERRAKDLVLPEPTSAKNIEVLMMSYGWWLTGIFDDWTTEQTECALKAALERSPAVVRCTKKLEIFAVRAGDEQENLSLLNFSALWFRSTFAQLEIGHKLAASLCLTDIPDDVEVRAPWEAWSLVIPDGLIQAASGERSATLSRVWMQGTTPVFCVFAGGVLRQFPEVTELPALSAMLQSLIRGACLALSNPDDFRKEKQHAPTARAQQSSRRHGPPDLQQARFFVSAPVKVDVREHVASALSGKSHASPTMQFLVRGHWRNQAHGPKHSLRKTIWVQPFWKGDPDTLILLRQHRVEEPPK